MSDISCALCGEPWDAYGVHHGDMEPEEAARFLHAKGCPACGFGTTCTVCNGTGRKPDDMYDRSQECPRCRGSRTVSVRLHKNRMWTGWQPTMLEWPLDEAGDPFNKSNRYHLRRLETFVCADGPVREVWARCPDCYDTAPPCRECDGTGAFRTRESEATRDQLWERHVTEALDASDEDPIEILERYL